jgi:hypothetical protein
MPCRRVATSVAVLGAAVSVMLTGCAGEQVEAPSSSPSVRAPASGRNGNGEDAGSGPALAAYQAMWKDMAVASSYADPAWPHLGDHADAGALRLLKYGLEKAQAEHVVTKGAPSVDPSVIASDANTVKLQDCVDGTHWLQYTKAGALKNDRPGSHSKADATVTRERDVWKVTALYLHESGTC